MLLDQVQLVSTGPLGLLQKAALLEHGIVPPQEKDFAPLLVEFHEAPVSPFLLVLSMTATPFAVANTDTSSPHTPILWHLPAYKGLHSVPSSRLFIRMVNRNANTVDPWCTPRFPGIQQDFVLLIITLPGPAAQPLLMLSAHKTKQRCSSKSLVPTLSLQAPVAASHGNGYVPPLQNLNQGTI